MQIAKRQRHFREVGVILFPQKTEALGSTAKKAQEEFASRDLAGDQLVELAVRRANVPAADSDEKAVPVIVTQNGSRMRVPNDWRRTGLFGLRTPVDDEKPGDNLAGESVLEVVIENPIAAGAGRR
jgi:hypothetical protein